MANNKKSDDIDFSQYKVKSKKSDDIDFSQYKVKNKPEESTGLSGIYSDASDAFSNALTGALNLPNTLEESGNYIAENPASSMAHNLGQAAAGVGDVVKGAINAPTDVPNYLLKKHLHPAQLFTPEEKEKQQEDINDTSDIAKSLSERVKSTFHGALADQLIKSLSKNLPQLPEDTGVEKALGLQPKPDSGDSLFRALAPTAALGLGLKGALKGGIQGYKKLNSLVNKQAGELTKAQQAENALKRSLEEAKKDTGESQFKAAGELSEQKSNLMEAHQDKAAEVESLIPNEPESLIKSQNVNHFGTVRKNLKSHFDQEYNDYRAGPGSNLVTEPLSASELVPLLKVLNPAGKEMAQGLIPKEVTLNIINPETKKPYVLSIPAENATVQDYIEMMRTARDARSKLNRDINKPNVTRADEIQMNKEANTLESLEKTVTQKIKGSVTDDEWKQFEGIQKDYKDFYRPFMDNNHLFDAWFNKRDSGQIFKELNQPTYARLFNALHEDPKFNELALSEALRGKLNPLTDSNPVTQAKKIDHLLAPHNSDVNRFMSPEQFAALKTLSTYGHLIGDADRTLQSLSNSLLSKATKAYDIAKATKLNPQAEKLLKDIQSKQLSQKEINARMKEAGIDTAEAKSKFQERQNANQMTKKALTISGAHRILNIF